MSVRTRRRTAGVVAAALVVSMATTPDGGATAAHHAVQEPATDARIEGRVVDEDGRPIAGLRVRTDATYGIPVGTEAVTTTRRDGSFVLANLGPATYRIKLGDDDSTSPAVSEYWPDAATFARGVDIVVSESQVVRGIDAVLTRAARIRGIFGDGVDDQQEYVKAYRWRHGAWEPFRSEHQDVPPGTYEISGLPAGRYRVMAAEGHSVQGPDNGPTITVKTGQVVAGPHIVFQDGGAISGNVSLQGAQTSDVALTLYQQRGARWFASDESPRTFEEFFEFGDIRPGKYRLGLQASGHRPEFWPNADEISAAHDILVAPGAEVEGVDSSLEPLAPGVFMTGRLTYPDGSPVAGAAAGLHRRTVEGGWEFVAGARTDAEGRYSIADVQPGTYRVEFSGTETEMIGNRFFGGGREIITGKDIVVPRPAADVAVPDSVVEPGGVVFGNIDGELDATRLQIGVVTAYRRTAGTWSVAAQDGTDWDGNYFMYGLPAGTYRIGTHDELQEYAPEFFTDAHSFADAQAITIEPQEQQTIDISVDFGVRNLAPPKVSGVARVDRKLRVQRGVWSPYRSRLEFRWLANGKPIRGAHGDTYRPRRRDVGKRITVRVTGAFPNYVPLAATTRPTHRIRP